jgi:hypothetical protein
MAYSGPSPLPIIAGGTAQTIAPAFNYYLNTSVTDATGDGTVYTFKCDTKQLDTTSSYNTATGHYTMPVGGTYLFNINVTLTGIISTHTTANMLLHAQGADIIYYVFNNNPFNCADATGSLTYNASTIIYLFNPDIISFTFSVSNGTKVVGIVGSDASSGIFTPTYIGGYLIP